MSKRFNYLRKCNDCARKFCLFDGSFPNWWYKSKKCKYKKKSVINKLKGSE